MNKFIPIVGVCLALGACGFTGTGDVLREGVREKGAQAYDEGLANAEWFLCEAASVGSIKRRYFRGVELADSYNALCGATGELRVEEE